MIKSARDWLQEHLVEHLALCTDEQYHIFKLLDHMRIKLAREWLKQHVSLCTDRQQHIFKLMYSRRIPHPDRPRDTLPNLDMSIDAVVDAMSDDKLDWAMQQIINTLDKNSK